jgi:hypothetical protein
LEADPRLHRFEKLIFIVFYFNQAGRVLLGQGGHSVPLSLWPVVLERANKMFKHSEDDDRERKRANVVFLLLQGPALMQRKFRDVIDSEKSENVQEYRLKT